MSECGRPLACFSVRSFVGSFVVRCPLSVVRSFVVRSFVVHSFVCCRPLSFVVGRPVVVAAVVVVVVVV